MLNYVLCVKRQNKFFFFLQAGTFFLKIFVKSLQVKEKCLPLHSQNEMVPWMSGLVYGLQNRPRRFESARHLNL